MGGAIAEIPAERESLCSQDSRFAGTVTINTKKYLLGYKKVHQGKLPPNHRHVIADGLGTHTPAGTCVLNQQSQSHKSVSTGNRIPPVLAPRRTRLGRIIKTPSRLFMGM